MPIRLPAALLASLCFAAPLGGQVACTIWSASDAQPISQLAVPQGFVEVCAQDDALCHTLTAGFPPSVRTLGYFVPAAEWTAFKEGRAQGFRRYLIVQLATQTQPADLPAWKSRLRAQQGEIPDHSRLPAMVESTGRAPLGVFDETERSVSFGVVMWMQIGGVPASEPPPLVVATNSIVVMGERVLSLYSYHPYSAPVDAETAKQFTRDWMRCIIGDSQPD